MGIVFAAQKTCSEALAKVPSRKRQATLVLGRGGWQRLEGESEKLNCCCKLHVGYTELNLLRGLWSYISNLSR